MENNPTPRESLMTFMMQDVERKYNAMHLLPCLWLDDAVWTSKDRKRRLVEGDEVCIKDGRLINCIGEPTHEILKCEANESATYRQITVKDLNTHQISTIRI